MPDRNRTIIILGLVALALAGSPAWAAENGDASGQLMELDWREIVVAIVVFLLLVFVLTKAAWKPILGGLKDREETIRQALDDAKKANEDARALIAEYEKRLDEATEEARAIAEEARKDAEHTRRRIEADAQERAEAISARANREIDQARDKAFEELLGQVASIATEVASRIVQRNLDAEGNAALVDRVVEEFATSRQGGGRA